MRLCLATGGGAADNQGKRRGQAEPFGISGGTAAKKR